MCTSNAAIILERADEFGSLREGLSADILIVDGDPASDISESRNVRHVLSQGRVVDRESLMLRR
jgi:imidazolonepropionase-like amidohydrolase